MKDENQPQTISYGTYEGFVQYLVHHPHEYAPFAQVCTHTDKHIHDRYENKTTFYKDAIHQLNNVINHIQSFHDTLNYIREGISKQLCQYSTHEQSSLDINVKDAQYSKMIQPYEQYLTLNVNRTTPLQPISIELPTIQDIEEKDSNKLDILGITPSGLSLIGMTLM